MSTIHIDDYNENAQVKMNEKRWVETQLEVNFQSSNVN